MSSIVAGRFASTAEAEEVARKLYERGFSVWDVSIMSVGARGDARSGVMLAARAKGERRDEATEVMRDGGGKDVEHAEGKWEGGQWVDFDAATMDATEDAPMDAAMNATTGADAEGEPWPVPLASATHGQGQDDGKAAPHPHAKPVAEEAVALDSTGNEDPGSELEHFVDNQVSRHS
ncbi:hypothetical protein [Cupriavidus plantarum]|uniref:Uncharacterized protein n=1 Tax=Cupriavidus plantarum TaxID=942865 RepID=A0A316EUL1_9BURK|nr:hypothetical protein [Cupriavidus plantarum]PWK35442.1 hypothetical protein C7419_102720 [Cupriavidus plantarum]